MGIREDALEQAAAMMDEWAEADDRVMEVETACCLRNAAKCIRALKSPSLNNCECGGCLEQVPGEYRSGMCYDCANEDCQHDYA